MEKPNCYECTYRRPIPGDAHISCIHPGSGMDHEDPVSGLLMLLGKRCGPVSAPSSATIHVEGDQWGIDHSWFNWPYNLDPTWLLSCDGFTPKEV
jgi:hypothetical protein